MNIAKYLQRIKYSDSLELNLKTLNKLHKNHTFNIPFENIDIMQGYDISIKLEDILTKILDKNRGGYCYELNKAFYYLLKNIGFKVHMCFARVLYQNPTMEDGIAPLSHRITIVTLGKKHYLADVGFGSFGIIYPIDIDKKESSKQYSSKYRIKKLNDEYYLTYKLKGEYIELYKFNLRDYLEVDYKYGNFFASKSKDSKFTKNFICTKPTKSGRVTIIDNEFKKFKNGSIKSKKISDLKREKLLKRVFQIEAI